MRTLQILVRASEQESKQTTADPEPEQLAPLDTALDTIPEEEPDFESYLLFLDRKPDSDDKDEEVAAYIGDLRHAGKMTETKVVMPDPDRAQVEEEVVQEVW